VAETAKNMTKRSSLSVVFSKMVGATVVAVMLTGVMMPTDALGAALSALKPIQYDPLEPTQIMAGVGAYRSSTVVALGLAHYKNESMLLHAGVSYAGGGDNHLMANAGVTWKFGNRSAEASVPDMYRRGPMESERLLGSIKISF